MPTEIVDRTPAKWAAAVAATALVVFALDTLAKQAVLATLELGDVREVIPGWLVLTHVQNTGVAYGLFAGQGWPLVLLSVGATVVVPVLLWRAQLWRERPVLAALAAGLILGGALGNLIERIQRGSVTDFLQVPPIPLFQVFNLADTAICVGAALLLLLTYRQGDAPGAEG